MCSQGNPAAIAASFADRSVPNLSSIALHVRHGRHTALLTGDARGDRLLSGLEATGLAEPGGTVDVTVFKLPHHGSARNASPALFRRVRAEHYPIPFAVEELERLKAGRRFEVDVRDAPAKSVVVELTD